MKHEGVWYWYDVVNSMKGGWEEYEEPLRRTLEEIEQLPGLPEDFIVEYIKEKDAVGLVIEFENPGIYSQAVCAIRNRLIEETYPIMIARHAKERSKLGYES